MSLTRRMTAEFLGTFWLVLGGCGSAQIHRVASATAESMLPGVETPG